MLIEIHMLKNFPPVNLNRDDTGAPKTCVFGGTTRGRISSQCLKRSWRTSELFREEIGEKNLGVRTRGLPRLVCEKLKEMGVSEELADAAMVKISGFGNKEGKENKDPAETAQMIFYADEDIKAVADAVKPFIEKCKNAKEVDKLKAKDLQGAIKDAQSRPVTADIALFGRMVTSDAFRNVEASMQVAHAISTGKTALESDYFTAMDDLLSGNSMDEIGAGMIGDIDYTASCYYHYASLDTDALAKNLDYSGNPGEIVKLVVPALLRAMAFTNPSGKQNSFAGHVLPSAMLVQCREKKVPVSLVNAYADAVSPGGDMTEKSIRKLADEADLMQRSFGLPVKESVWFCVDKYDCHPESATKVCASFPELVESVAACLS